VSADADIARPGRTLAVDAGLRDRSFANNHALVMGTESESMGTSYCKNKQYLVCACRHISAVDWWGTGTPRQNSSQMVIPRVVERTRNDSTLPRRQAASAEP